MPFIPLLSHFFPFLNSKVGQKNAQKSAKNGLFCLILGCFWAIFEDFWSILMILSHFPTFFFKTLYRKNTIYKKFYFTQNFWENGKRRKRSDFMWISM